VGGGAALPAWSDRTGHFYVRSDPGTTIATLQPAENGLTQVAEVTVRVPRVEFAAVWAAAERRNREQGARAGPEQSRQVIL
jgi:hypothetical protein